MALQLNLRPRNPKALPNPSLVHLFSSNSSAPSDPNEETTDTPSTAPTGSSQSSFSAYFSDVKARLKQQHQHSTPPPPRKPSYPFTPFSNRSSSQHSKAAAVEEITKHLNEFRIRSSVPLPSEPSSSSSGSSSQHGISFQELYQRNVMAKGGGATGASDSMVGGQRGKLSFEAIRDSLRRQLRSSGTMQNERRGGDSMSLSAFKDSLKLKPSDSAAAPSSTIVLGGTERLPESIFGKEMRDRKEGESEEIKTEFLRMYSHNELGSKLRALRPDNARGQNWFSLTELNERLMKLRKMEEKETESRIGGFPFKDLRESLLMLNNSDLEKTKKATIHRLDILGRTPDFMLHPPKEHLAEKYFHPDNMSSAEKLKIELVKVRDEFKMSESDCGSARVQVAQLTTKIKHLSSVLHKKDKHSKKGLLAMVQQRKKLLKYLRRTDWESYCLVLSKLGLRDNPDYKN